jgi:excisionase family DNA binding protein
VSDSTDLLTMKETAAALRLGSSKTWTLIATGAVPSVRLGRRVLVLRSDLRRYIEAHREGGYEGAATGSTPVAAQGSQVRNGRRVRV